MIESERDVLLRRIKVLQAKLERAVEQRDGFMKNYHACMRVPFSERNEILTDCNEDLEKLSGPDDV